MAQVLDRRQTCDRQHGGELKSDASGNVVLDTHGVRVDWNHRVLMSRPASGKAYLDGPCYRKEKPRVLELLCADRRTKVEDSPIGGEVPVSRRCLEMTGSDLGARG